MHWWEILGWGALGIFALLVLWLISFYVRLGKTERTITRAVALAHKCLAGTELTPEEQKEVDEFCHRGILQKLQIKHGEGQTTTLYTTTDDPVLAELSS